MARDRATELDQLLRLLTLQRRQRIAQRCGCRIAPHSENQRCRAKRQRRDKSHAEQIAARQASRLRWSRRGVGGVGHVGSGGPAGIAVGGESDAAPV